MQSTLSIKIEKCDFYSKFKLNYHLKRKNKNKKDYRWIKIETQYIGVTAIFIQKNK